MQCTISVEVYTKEAWKLSLHITALTGGLVAYNSCSTGAVVPMYRKGVLRNFAKFTAENKRSPGTGVNL